MSRSPDITRGQHEKAAAGWIRGVHSSRNPFLLDDAQYAWSVNTVNRGGIIQTRPGKLLALTLPSGNLQGEEVITINKLDQNGNAFQDGQQFHVAAVDGKIYASAFPLSQPDNWETRRLTNLQFNANAKHVYFCVAQKSVNTIGGNLSLTTTYSLLVMQDGVGKAGYWDGAVNGHVSELAPDLSIPTGTWMSFSGNRLWLARDNALISSDLLDPLSFQERLSGTGRGDFVLPSLITGMINTVGANFQANLVVFTSDQTFSFLSNIADREQWSTTPNFQVTLYPSLGCVAGLSIVNHAGLLWWYSSGGLVSSNSATTAYLTSRIKYQDVEMAFSTSRLYEDASGICAASFGSYLLMSIPSGDVFNSDTMVLDYSVADEQLSQEAPAWQGVWTGTRPVKWVTAKIASANGAIKCYEASVDYEPLNGSHNHIWENFQDDRTDSYSFLNASNDLEVVHNKIYCEAEMKLEGDGLDLKTFKYSFFNLCELSGEVNFKVSYRGTLGSYKEVFNSKIIAITEPWQTTNQEIINLINSGEVLVPQTRKLRTETASADVKEEEFLVESKNPESIDHCFSLLFQWCGRGAVESFDMVMQPYAEKSQGECTPDEDTLNIVTQNGTSQRFSEGPTGSITIIAPPEPTPNFQNQLYNRPFTPRYRKVYYSSIPPQNPAPSEGCITCLPCARDEFPPVVFDPTLNDTGGGGGPLTYIGNDAQSYTATCPAGTHGSSVTITIPAEFTFALSKDSANQIAYNLALAQATSEIVCTPNLVPNVQSESITVTAGVPFTYQIVAANGPILSYGATLPAGLSLDTVTGIISGTLNS